MPGNDTQQKFVPRFEMAVMQYVILSKASEGEVTRENLKQTFTGNLKMSSEHFDHCIRQLVQDGHLKEQGNKFTVTDDGREDIQKLQHLVLELPNVVNQGGQRQGMTQQKTTTGGSQGQSGGSSGSSMGGSSGTVGQGGGNKTGSSQGGQQNNVGGAGTR